MHYPLSPLDFLARAGRVHADRLAVVDGERRFSYAELWDRSCRLAAALRPLAEGQAVAVLGPNSHAVLEANFGVPMAGSALVPLNTRLTAADLSYIIGHSESVVLLCDSSLVDTGRAAVRECSRDVQLIVMGGPSDDLESLLASQQPFAGQPLEETDLFSLNYTSGTTGRPKGVMYDHRGVYLQSLAMHVHTGLSAETRMLWTLPMFHCHGWCFTYAVTAAGGTHVCMRSFDAENAWTLIRDERITHLNGAPTVLASIAAAEGASPLPAGRRLKVGAGGAPPSPALLGQLADFGIDVTHLYGLTETFGPAVINDWHPEWNALDREAQARLQARQGVSTVVSCPLRVVDETGADVAADGVTVGEVAFRGNNVMLGYFKDEEATRAAIPDGWFRTGDVGVLHEDGYLELRDRSKDVIISGGENISSIEVEQAVAAHPDVFEVAVIAAPHVKWGEVPVAYVSLHPGAQATEESIINHARDRLAHFKAPKRVVFGDLPKTGTGKIQKYLLRADAWSGYDRRIN